MEHSNVLLSVALRKLDHNWHINLSFSGAVKLCQRVRAKILNLDTTTVITQTYVPKVRADGTSTWRPIGSPSYEDRMFSFIWQGMLVQYLAAYIGKSQHAYLPGRGVLTAWSQIAKLCKEYGFVYEFDLKGAFPSVSIPYATRRLTELGCPEGISNFLFELSSRALPTLDRSKQRLEEPKIDRQEELAQSIPVDYFAAPLVEPRSTWLDQGIDAPQTIHSMETFGPGGDSNSGTKMTVTHESGNMFEFEIFDEGDILFKTTPILASPAVLPNFGMAAHVANIPPVPTPESWEFVQTPLEEAKGIFPQPTQPSTPIELRGFPQGHGLSPILFDFVFADALERAHFGTKFPGAKIVAYADDFLIFSKTFIKNFLEQSAALWESGLEFSVEKSREIRRDGKWLSKFKFLGVTYFPNGLADFHAYTPDKPEGLALRELLKEPLLLKGGVALPEGVPRLVGTPRPKPNEEGHLVEKVLHMDASTTLAISTFAARDQQLWRLSRFVPAFEGLTPQAILDGWGRGEFPFNLIPSSVMDGTKRVSGSLISKLKTTTASDDSSPSGAAKAQGPKTFNEYLTSLAARDHLGPLSWLLTRRAGFVMSRLHFGSFRAENAVADRRLFERIPAKFTVPVYTNGKPFYRPQPWLSLARGLHSKVTVFNSTSYATRDLLNKLSNPSSVRVRKGSLLYSFPSNVRKP